jgi:Family of unknown function (DUF5681)
MFEKGQSGNPAGRPPGIRDKRTAMRDLLLPHAPELVAKAVEMAKNGDAAALRICLDRLIPPAKARDDPVSLPTLTDSLADNSRVVIKALGEGELTPDEAATVLQSLASQVRIIEADEIEKRLAALEQAAGKIDYR